MDEAVRRRLLQEGGAWLTHGLLYGLGYLPSRHRPKRARDLRTVVLVHGLGATRASFFPLQAYLALVGHRRHYSYNYQAGGSIEELALGLRERLATEVRGGRIDIVAHSLGGLVARYYVQRLGGARRVDRLITLATPHAGTHASVYVPTPVVRQLAPDSEFLRTLNALPPPAGVRLTTLAARRDLLVLPASSALLPWAEQRMYDDLGHMDILLSPRVFERVHRALLTQ